MKLSEAIRLNGMMKPQGRGLESMDSLDAPCALGGALQSIGKQLRTGSAWHAIVDNWPFTREPVKCPCGSDHRRGEEQDEIAASMVFTIVLLNDFHEWTRNQIANWVATVEPAEEVEQGAALPSGSQEVPPRVATR